MKGVNTIGFGYDTNEFYTNADESTTDKLFRGFGSTFEYVVTSPNVLETLLVYEVLHAAMMSAIDTLDEYFNNITITSKELVAKNDAVPQPLFLKCMMIDVDYVKSMPRLGTPEQFASMVEFYPPILYSEEGIGVNLIE
jgi:hypothetical protein